MTTQINQLTELTSTSDGDLLLIRENATGVDKKMQAVNLRAKATTKDDVGLGNVDNVSAANLRDRSTHTGTQPLSTISDAGTIATQDANSVNIDGGTIDGTAVNATTLTASGDVNFDSGTLFVDASTNRVGINTASPTRPIEIQDSVNPSIRLTEATSGHFHDLASFAGNYFVDANKGAEATGGSVIFRTSENEVMRIAPSGNVGIGTTSPSEKLEISGSNSQIIKLNNTDPTLSVGQITGAIHFSQNDSSAGGTGISGRIAMRSANRPDTGSYFGTSSDMGFFVSGAPDGSVGVNATTEALTIRSNGNVGIGTTSPNTRLKVVDGVMRVDRNAADVSLIATGTGSNFQVDHSVNGFATLLNSGGGLAFKTLSSEAMRIDSSGNVLVGLTSISGAFGRITTRGVSGTSYSLRCDSAITSADAVVAFSNPNGIVGTVTTSGSSTSYNTSSDYRLKENIQPLTGALDKVQAMNPVTYDWKAGGEGEGFIAHELQEIAPYAVSGEKDGEDMQGVDYGKLTTLLVGAVKELTAKVEQLEAQLGANNGN